MEKRKSHTKLFVARLVGMRKTKNVSVTAEGPIMDWVTNKKSARGFCLKLSPTARKTLREFALVDLETAIDEAKCEIANLQIAGFHAKAEKKRKALQFYWELWNELNQKVTNIEIAQEKEDA